MMQERDEYDNVVIDGVHILIGLTILAGIALGVIFWVCR